jgi:hypothetical protein
LKLSPAKARRRKVVNLKVKSGLIKTAFRAVPAGKFREQAVFFEIKTAAENFSSRFIRVLNKKASEKQKAQQKG